ncbi:TetR/AcrR family transcriptional regulator [Niallia circulans]|uniref:TetR family transcriptional regulator n=1 Tax=Shouchella clausii TaxID=79880 RepID=UPI000BA70E2F|nr:TetR family transcriptional regulator [Shouchella clausii]PAF14373.1 TetR family transcriptional regulator [Shouchella clausii]SPU19165.1 TetR/AcrR family transcriptional regulator [Niallia circulans]
MDKKERIVEAAIVAFKEKGVEKTTITDIVKRAGIAQGTYYLYFPSKLAIMPSIAEVFVNKLIDRLHKSVRSDSIERQIEEVVEAIFSITEEHNDLAILIYSGLTQTEYVKEWEMIYAPLYDWFDGMLARALDKKAIRETINTAYTAKIMVGVIESTAEQLYLYDQHDQASAQAHKNELISFISNALGASGLH